MASDDNLYPASSEFLIGEPKDQQLARIEERDNVFQAYPILQEMLDRLRERIAFYKNVDSVPGDVLLKPDEFMHTVAANKLAAANLQAELDNLETLIKQHVDPQL